MPQKLLTNVKLQNEVLTIQDAALTTRVTADETDIANIKTDYLKKANLAGTTGQSTTTAMTQKAVTDALATGGVTVVQTTGTSTTSVMSQKAVTDNLNLKADKTQLPNIVQEAGLSETDIMSQKAVSNMYSAGMNLKFDKVNVVQTTGTSTNKVMSQKAVTDNLALKFDLTDIVHTSGGDANRVLSQTAVEEKLNTKINKTAIQQEPGAETDTVISTAGLDRYYLPKTLSTDNNYYLTSWDEVEQDISFHKVTIDPGNVDYGSVVEVNNHNIAIAPKVGYEATTSGATPVYIDFTQQAAATPNINKIQLHFTDAQYTDFRADGFGTAAYNGSLINFHDNQTDGRFTVNLRGLSNFIQYTDHVQIMINPGTTRESNYNFKSDEILLNVLKQARMTFNTSKFTLVFHYGATNESQYMFTDTALDMKNKLIQNLAEPTVPHDACNRLYADQHVLNYFCGGYGAGTLPSTAFKVQWYYDQDSQTMFLRKLS